MIPNPRNRKSHAERAAIADAVLIVLARAGKPCKRTWLIKECSAFASDKSVLFAVNDLYSKRLIHVGQVGPAICYSVANNAVIPVGDPAMVIQLRRQKEIKDAKERIHQHCLLLMRAEVYPSRERLMKDLGLPDSIVRPTLEQLIDDGEIDVDDLPQTHAEVGLGRNDRWRIERRTAVVLALKLGMKRPPKDWRRWREGIRNENTEVMWQSGFFLVHDGRD